MASPRGERQTAVVSAAPSVLRPVQLAVVAARRQRRRRRYAASCSQPGKFDMRWKSKQGPASYLSMRPKFARHGNHSIRTFVLTLEGVIGTSPAVEGCRASGPRNFQLCFRAWSCFVRNWSGLSDEHGVVLAKALRGNGTLQSFTLLAEGTQLGDEVAGWWTSLPSQPHYR